VPTLRYSPLADDQLDVLESDGAHAVRLKAVRKALGKMEINIRHPGLNTKPYRGEKCPHGDTLFEAYAQNKTPGAYRIFWCYMPPPARDEILIVAITPHP
jgi:hypothetical protein